MAGLGFLKVFRLNVLRPVLVGVAGEIRRWQATIGAGGQPAKLHPPSKKWAVPLFSFLD